MPTTHQQELHGRRGRAGDRLYKTRRTLHTGAELLTDKQQKRLKELFTDERHVAVQVTWGIHQRMALLAVTLIEPRGKLP